MQPQHQVYRSARSWPSVEQIDGSTAARSHGPGSSDDNRNTNRRLDTFSSPDDEQARSAILLRFPCEQYHKGIWEESNMPAYNKTCQNSLQSRFCVGQTPVRTLWPDIKTMVSHTKLTVHFATPKQLSRCVNPNELRTGRSESNLRLY